MSPEYAMHGQFSVKSDAYSFGVLILEIISGKKNSSFYQTGGAADLASYVSEVFFHNTTNSRPGMITWKKKKHKVIETFDPSIFFRHGNIGEMGHHWK
jgi:uncharacterized protein (UPF0303 family)